MAENKVRFLKGTATEYVNATKDDDTFYYTTDDEKFYIGSKEITSEGVTVDDTLSDTSEHPVQNKVIKAALDKKLDTFLKGAANGLAELDSSGKVPTSQLPSYVDDVIEGYLYNSKFYKESAHTTEITGETGKIYVDLSTNKTYRWSGSTFVVISETLVLGETSTTAYRGDRGKIAYNHSQTAHAPSNAEANQNAFSNVVVGSTTITADNKTDTLTLVGSNVTLTPDATNDKVTIGITKANVTAALGYTPPTTNTTYGVATSSALGLIKSGTDITVDANGNVSVNDDSHNHIISNIDGLQSALDGKAASSHNQASSTINAMTGYSKPSSTAAIATSDTLNSAIGKLEKALDGKAAVRHTHTISEITDFPTSLPANGGNADTVGNVAVSSSDEVGLRKISAGTDDLTAGTSALETGAIYIVYE